MQKIFALDIEISLHMWYDILTFMGSNLMGSLLLNVGILGGIWNFVSGTIAKIGAALSTSFVPVADSIWAGTMGVIKAVPAFCMAHPGAVILGAVSLIAGVKLVKGLAKKFKEMKTKVKASVAARRAEKIAEEQMIQQAVAEKSAEKASSKSATPAAKKPAKKESKDISRPVYAYLENLSAEDNLHDYMDYRSSKSPTKTITHSDPMVSYGRPKMSDLYRRVDNSVFTPDIGLER